MGWGGKTPEKGRNASRAQLPDNLFMYSHRTISYRQGSVEGGALSSLKRPSNNGHAIRNIAGYGSAFSLYCPPLSPQPCLSAPSPREPFM